jgi:hypothetical protein
MTAPWAGPIPLPDPLGQPAPFALLWALLMLLFLLHLLAMNVMLGGSIIGAVARVRAGRGNHPHDAQLAAWFAAAMPVLIATAVTLGVAALLFLQVLYGRLFFTSSVLIGWFWLAVIPVLVLAYGLAYRLAFGSAREAGAGRVASWALALGLVALGFVYVNNMSLLIRPDRFVPMYVGSAQSFHLNLGDPTFLPRFLHMVLGAVAVAGLAVAHVGLGRERRDPDFGRWAMRQGCLWFSVATGASLIAGVWWLAALPKETVLRFMGQNMGAALALTGGVLAGLASLTMMTIAIAARRPAGIIRGASGVLVFALALMILTRDQVRTAALESAGYQPTAWIAPQWGLMALFALLLLVALALIGGMVAALVRGAPGSTTAGTAGAALSK